MTREDRYRDEARRRVLALRDMGGAFDPRRIEIRAAGAVEILNPKDRDGLGEGAFVEGAIWIPASEVGAPIDPVPRELVDRYLNEPMFHAIVERLFGALKFNHGQFGLATLTAMPLDDILDAAKIAKMKFDNWRRDRGEIAEDAGVQIPPDHLGDMLEGPRE